MARHFPSASLVENVRFNRTVIVPNALQGLFKRRRTAVAVATAMNIDAQAVKLCAGLRDRHGGSPVWVRVVRDRALLLLDVADVRRALKGSPHPFASDPPAKRKGMAHFQPDALTLSRGDLWADRRRFTEAVLDSPHVTHRLAERVLAVVDEEVGAAAGGPAPLDYARLHTAYRRLTRRLVLGEEAADDEEVSDLLGELMGQANGLPSKRSDEYEPFMATVEGYVRAAGGGSLAALVAEAPSTPDTRVAGQVPHWLFATQDTLSANVLRALALLASHDVEVQPEPSDPGLRATLQEAMRLWPTTPLLSRETLVELGWHGVQVPKGTDVLIPNTFHHRDRARLGDAADRFTPEAWIDDGFGSDWGLNFFSHGPQACPGANLALLIGGATLATVLRAGTPKLVSCRLDPSKPLPHMLDVFALRLEVS